MIIWSLFLQLAHLIYNLILMKFKSQNDSIIRHTNFIA